MPKNKTTIMNGLKIKQAGEAKPLAGKLEVATTDVTLTAIAIKESRTTGEKFIALEFSSLDGTNVKIDFNVDGTDENVDIFSKLYENKTPINFDLTGVTGYAGDQNIYFKPKAEQLLKVDGFKLKSLSERLKAQLKK